MRRLASALAGLSLVAAAFATSAAAAPQDFGLEAVDAELSTTQAGAHPDLTFSFAIKQDPATKPNPFGFKDGYAATRDVRFELPPGLVGDPNVLGVPQQCTVEELLSFFDPEGGCPNGSQIGVSDIFTYEYGSFTEPIYMMAPPGGDVVARIGTIAGVFPIFIDLRVRSESDYGIVAEVRDSPTKARLVKLESTTWGVPAHPSHDTERCTIAEAIQGCVVSEPRPPGSRPLPFLTNPTRCGVPLEMKVSVSSWVEPHRFDTKAAPLPTISGCDDLPFGPGLTVEPTSRRASAPTGLDVTVRMAGPDGVNVLEPSQMRDIRVGLPDGLVINPGSADGLTTCSKEQVRFEERVSAECPDSAKIASAEFDIPALPRRMKGAIYLREPEPGNLFRVWVVADDLGAHLKLPGQLQVDQKDGQISSVILDVPQVPLREAKLVFFPGERAPLVNPPSCGTHLTSYLFTPWSGTPAVSGRSPMQITEACGPAGFSPTLSAGGTDPAAGAYSPFLFTLFRQDREGNPASLAVSVPRGLLAKLAGVPRCPSQATATGACPAASKIGTAMVATGYGAAPLWVPQPGKDPTAVFLAGPYKGAPFSIVVVVPAQAGPFDLGRQVVRSAVQVDPTTAQATVVSDPLPQIIEGIPIAYRQIHVHVDRPNFTLNPTSCKEKETTAEVVAATGALAHPSFGFQAVECGKLAFKPRLSFRLAGPAHRGAHPRLRVVLNGRRGDANIARASATLPRSQFFENAHIDTVCTRVQFARESCPKASIYGHATAFTPLLDEPLKGPVYLRSSSNLLPDLVAALDGELDFDLVGAVDTVGTSLRTTFSTVPDAPVTKFVLNMRGGRKSLLVNSANLCKAPSFVVVQLRAQNGKRAGLRPKLQSSSCGKQKPRKGKRG